MKTILVRADGSKNIGMGHLNRCILIADYLLDKKNINTVILIRDDEAARLFVQGKNTRHKVTYLGAGISESQELQVIGDLLRDNRVALILLDLLEDKITGTYLQTLKRSGKPVSVITDDSQHREFDADLILNGNPNQNAGEYSGLNGTYLIGPGYFLMDPAYADLPEKPVNCGNSVLLTLGGSDHNDLLFTVLDALAGNENVDEIVVVSSRSTGYSDRLKKHAEAQHKPVKLYFDIQSIAPVWQQCDLAVTAGGNTLFERIASGTPGATICQLKRQMEIADKFEELRVNRNIGFGPDLDKDTLTSRLNRFILDTETHDEQLGHAGEVTQGKGLKLYVDSLCALIGE